MITKADWLYYSRSPYQFIFDAIRLLSLALLDMKLQLESMKLQEQVVDLPFCHHPCSFSFGQLWAQVHQLSLEWKETTEGWGTGSRCVRWFKGAWVSDHSITVFVVCKTQILQYILFFLCNLWVLIISYCAETLRSHKFSTTMYSCGILKVFKENNILHIQGSRVQSIWSQMLISQWCY